MDELVVKNDGTGTGSGKTACSGSSLSITNYTSFELIVVGDTLFNYSEFSLSLACPTAAMRLLRFFNLYMIIIIKIIKTTITAKGIDI